MDQLKIKPFSSVSANGLSSLATNELVGRSLHALKLELGGTSFPKSAIENIVIRAGGKTIVEGITGAQLQAMNDYEGLNDTANYLFFYFGDPTARTLRGQHMADLDLSIYRGDPLQIEISIGAATAPTLQVWAIVGPPKAQYGAQFSEAEVVLTRALVRTQIDEGAAINRKAHEIGIGSHAGGRIK